MHISCCLTPNNLIGFSLFEAIITRQRKEFRCHTHGYCSISTPFYMNTLGRCPDAAINWSCIGCRMPWTKSTKNTQRPAVLWFLVYLWQFTDSINYNNHNNVVITLKYIAGIDLISENCPNVFINCSYMKCQMNAEPDERGRSSFVHHFYGFRFGRDCTQWVALFAFWCKHLVFMHLFLLRRFFPAMEITFESLLLILLLPQQLKYESEMHHFKWSRKK